MNEIKIESHSKIGIHSCGHLARFAKYAIISCALACGIMNAAEESAAKAKPQYGLLCIDLLKSEISSLTDNTHLNKIKEASLELIALERISNSLKSIDEIISNPNLDPLIFSDQKGERMKNDIRNRARAKITEATNTIFGFNSELGKETSFNSRMKLTNKKLDELIKILSK